VIEPAELEARIRALEAAPETPDFDRSSWVWIILFGVALPAILILVGWWV
jgi:hypothetical protein